MSRGQVTLEVVASCWIPRWIDLDPFLYYAKERPEDVIHLIGDATNVIGKNAFPRNIILRGPKHWKQLPAYIHPSI